MEIEIIAEKTDKRATSLEEGEKVTSSDIREEESSNEETARVDKGKAPEVSKEPMIVFMKKRHKCRIPLEKMPGKNSEEKLENATFALSDYANFLGAKIVLSQKGHFIVAEFGDFNDLTEACALTFRDNEEDRFEVVQYQLGVDTTARMVWI